MPLPALFAAGKAVLTKAAPIARAIGSKLARRGATTGIVAGGGAAATAGAGRRILAGGAKAIAGGAAFEVGSRAIGGRFAGERKQYRRMNVGNIKALNRATRRLKGFVDMSDKVIKQIARTMPAKTRRTVHSRSRSCGCK